MSDQETEALIFGNQNLPAGTADRPLVTFAVFAYNQEDFVRDAIESAFAQTYEPLEIILSDDGSSDRTFALMQEAAESYRGRHSVIVRRNEKNLGVLGHVLAVAGIASGEFLVVAAGDDISFPDRTERQVCCLMGAGSDVAVVSGADIVFDSGGDWGRAEWSVETLRKWLSEMNAWFHGATACYRISVLRRLPIPSEVILREDMAIMAFFEGCGYYSKYLEEPLIRRRAHGRNIGLEMDLEDPWENELRIIRRLRHIAETWDYSARAIEGAGFDAGVIRSRASILRQYVRWPEMGFGERLNLLINSLRFRYLRKSSLYVVFGRGAFVFAKSLRRTLRGCRGCL